MMDTPRYKIPISYARGIGIKIAQRMVFVKDILNHIKMKGSKNRVKTKLNEVRCRKI